MSRLTLLLLAAVVLSGPALAQAPAAPAPAAPAPLDPAQAASKAAFEAQPEAERRAIQSDLIWTGHFNGVASGEFGLRTFEAIRRFERQQNVAPNGILAPDERAGLHRLAEAQRQAARFAAVTDPATGIRIGLPQAVLTQRVTVQNGVVHRRPDGQVSLQLLTLPATSGLPDLFETLRQDGPGRKVTYRLQRPDWFVVSGEEGPRRFYTRIAQGPQGLRGYTFRYPASEAAQAERLMIAIANSFEPFPGTAVASNPASAPVAAATPVAPTLPRPTVVAHGVSAIRIGPDRAVTSRVALAGCASPQLGGQPLDPAKVAIRGDVAVISGVGSGPAVPLAGAPARGPVYAVTRDALAPQSVVVAAGVIDGGAGEARLRAALQVAPAGAPVLNAAGQLVAMVRDAPQRLRLVGDVVPLAEHRLVDLSALTAALGGAGGAATTPGLRQGSAALLDIRCATRP